MTNLPYDSHATHIFAELKIVPPKRLYEYMLILQYKKEVKTHSRILQGMREPKTKSKNKTASTHCTGCIPSSLRIMDSKGLSINYHTFSTKHIPQTCPFPNRQKMETAMPCISVLVILQSTRNTFSAFVVHFRTPYIVHCECTFLNAFFSDFDCILYFYKPQYESKCL